MPMREPTPRATFFGYVLSTSIMGILASVPDSRTWLKAGLS